MTLNTINLNTNLMFRGDIAIEVELINQGTAINLLQVDPILLLRQDNHNVDSVLELVWDKVIKTPEWNPNLSKKLSNFIIQLKDNLKRALENTKGNGDWETYVISILGYEEDGTGRDVAITVHGKIKMIDNPITTNLAIDLTNKNYHFNATKLDTSAWQGFYLGSQIWEDVVKQQPFTDIQADTFGISRNQRDWNVTELGRTIGDKIENYNPNIAQDISLQFELILNNPGNYQGKITVTFKLTPGNPISFGDVDLSAKSVPVFIRKLPTTENEKESLLDTIMKSLLNDRITNNSALHNQHPNVPLNLFVYNAFDPAILKQLALPTEAETVKETTITIHPDIPLFEGSIKLKVKLIYQP
ncbi:hypothetical protein [Spiroplasma sp. SV19]|uniref:hypothetical protein n=1 Tax=Spiroplasma sp. SV19 TaxID=2570468 RepID=UPI0024B7561D|nr:hypothetical protein [Spiroplasma sp. SV19]WHQ36809.1 hypothetical protein E7Y35_02750 [Spiroplasma sp. SV19]